MRLMWLRRLPRRALALASRPDQLALALRIGWFVWRLPQALERTAVPTLLAGLETAPRPRTGDLDRSLARVVWLRQAWLRLPGMRSRNTCYVRAFTLFRFIDAWGRDLRIHLGVEPGVDPGDRLRGHAWVTLDGRILEPPPAVLAGRVRELFAFPGERDQGGAGRIAVGER